FTRHYRHTRSRRSPHWIDSVQSRHRRRCRRIPGRVGFADPTLAVSRVHRIYGQASMTFRLQVHGRQWRTHLDSVYTPDIVPVIKGNGYGLGRENLVGEALQLGADIIAVGTYHEVPDALEAFDGDVMVLSPWRSFWATQ